MMPTMNAADRILAAVAARQHGVFSRAQAYEAGLERWALSYRCREGLVTPVGTRTFAFAGAPVSWRGMLQAGLLDLGDDAVPHVQRVYRADGRHVARVDFDFAPLPVVVEVGGRKGYLTTQERQRQERRRTQLQLLGKVVYFFAHEDVVHDPAYVVDTLAAVGLRRAS